MMDRLKSNALESETQMHKSTAEKVKHSGIDFEEAKCFSPSFQDIPFNLANTELPDNRSRSKDNQLKALR